MTQTKSIIKYLKKGKPITALQAQNLFGCMRLSARIYDIEKLGYEIVRHWVTTKNRYGDFVRIKQYSIGK